MKVLNIPCITVMQIAQINGAIINHFLVTDSKDLPKADDTFNYMYAVKQRGITYESALKILLDSEHDSTKTQSAPTEDTQNEKN